MEWILFLDDEREPFGSHKKEFGHLDKDKTVICKDAGEAIAKITKDGLPVEMHLDGYLGLGLHGMQFLMWLKQYHSDGMKNVEVSCHSSDFETRQDMRRFVYDAFGVRSG